MKYLQVLLFAGLSTCCLAQSNPAENIPTFNFDDYFVPPKFTMSVGTRVMTGASTGFDGTGKIVIPTEDPGDLTTTGIIRRYHDGAVGLDTRKDANGDPLNANDGMVNNWGMASLDQIVNNEQDIAFSIYSAEITAGGFRDGASGASLGSEVMLARDMGKIGKHITWKLFFGVGVNSIAGKKSDTSPASFTKLTDIYSLNGQTPPTTAPYAAPTSTIDENGNIVDTSILISGTPSSRTITTSTGTVANSWHLKGTFVTVRLGPSVSYAFNDKFRLTVSAGPVWVYSGTTFSVGQSFIPDTGAPIVGAGSTTDGKALTGYYADASLEYLINDRTGVYMGAFAQSSGSYNQSITNNAGTYMATVDLEQMQGLRAGLSYKF